MAWGFNPTLVRLRPHPVPRLFLRILEFQSHAGSIEAVKTFAEFEKAMRFQSHAGSIEATFVLILVYLVLSVSIPRWFD